MTLKAKFDKMLWNSTKLVEKSTNIFEKEESFLRPRLKSVVDTLQGSILRDVPVTPVVAGGFIRDTLVGVKPKDLDVFIQFDPTLDEFDIDHYKTLIADRLNADNAGEEEQPFFGFNDMSENYGQGQKNEQILEGVVEFESAGELPLENSENTWYPPRIQLIAHRQNTADLLDRFDLNICKVAYVPHEDVFIYTSAFLKDFNNKKVTIDPRHVNNKSTLKRHDRISNKMSRAWTPAGQVVGGTSNPLMVYKWNYFKDAVEQDFFNAAAAQEQAWLRQGQQGWDPLGQGQQAAGVDEVLDGLEEVAADLNRALNRLPANPNGRNL